MWKEQLKNRFPVHALDFKRGDYVADIVWDGFIFLLREEEPTMEEKAFWEKLYTPVWLNKEGQFQDRWLESWYQKQNV